MTMSDVEREKDAWKTDSEMEGYGEGEHPFPGRPWADVGRAE